MKSIVSSWVITLVEDNPIADSAIQRMRLMPGVTLGAPIAHQLPVVVETHSMEDGIRLAEEIQQINGVVHINVIRVEEA